MTAYNVVGESPASAPVEVFVGEAGKPPCPHPAAPARVPAASPSSKNSLPVGQHVPGGAGGFQVPAGKRVPPRAGVRTARVSHLVLLLSPGVRSVWGRQAALRD